jgi:predicted flap endonuclease-1-like 5' DNA nuclease
VLAPAPLRVATTGLAALTPRDLEAELWKAGPGQPTKARFSADDLTTIKGITPETGAWLGQNGITRFSQIASLTASELFWLVENLPSDGASVYRDQWVAQAAKLIGQD